MNTKHTPGPWHWMGTKQPPQAKAYLVGSNNHHVGAALNEFTDNVADAQLIAVAPDLLTTLQGLQQGIADIAEIARRDGQIAIRNLCEEKLSWIAAAIAKATQQPV